MIATPFRFSARMQIRRAARFSIREGGRRLVHHQNPGVLRQRLRDLDHLLLRHAELVRRRARVDIETEAVEEVTRVGVHLPVADRSGNPLRRVRGRGRCSARGSGKERGELPGKMTAIPRRRASAGDPSRTGRPSTKISPASGCCAPHRMRISVDLPARSARAACTVPASTDNDTSSSARTPGNVLEIPRISGKRAPRRRNYASAAI